MGSLLSWTSPQDPACDFTPDFLGTLLEYSDYNSLPGQVDLTCLTFGGVVYGNYDANWNLSFANPIGFINPQLYAYIGLTKHIQLEFALSPLTIFFRNRSATTLQDLNVGLGFQFLWDKKGTAVPNLRFDANLVLPTGKYEHLNPFLEQADQGGRGTYGGICTLVVNKTFYNIPCHTYNFALNISYYFYGVADVHGINVYSQGLPLNGRGKPGSEILIDFAMEYAFSKHYALALDFQYTHVQKNVLHTHFPGSHQKLTLTSPSADLFQVVPVLEFMINPTIGFYAGASWSLIGRNIASFAQLVLGMDLTF